MFEAEQGRAENAYRYWLNQHRFVNALLAAPDALVLTFVKLAVESFSMGALTDLVRIAPEIGDLHIDEIRAILAPHDLDRHQLGDVL